MVGSDRLGSSFYTDRAPAYSLTSSRTQVSIGVATALIVGTLVLMLLFRGTVFAAVTVWLYVFAPFAPFPGVVVFGILLTGGRYVGLMGAAEERHVLALAASAVVGVAYAAFGAGVLMLFAPALHGTAVLLTAALTTGITVGAAALVYTTDHSFARWDRHSGTLMIAGMVVLVIGGLTGGLQWLTFGLILLGWIVDLVFEIYMVNNDHRSPLANVIGV